MPKFQDWITEDGFLKLEGWARDGYTDEEIAKRVGVTKWTLCVWKKEHAQIGEALKRGKEAIDYSVERAMLSRALAGDVTAGIFWLCNRRPDKWRRNADAYSGAGIAKPSSITIEIEDMSGGGGDDRNAG